MIKPPVISSRRTTCFHHQSTWSTRCRVWRKWTCCLFFLLSLFYEGNFFLIVCCCPLSCFSYRMYRKSQETGFPSLVTIFSAPNYLELMFVITKVCWGRYIYTRVLCFLFVCCFWLPGLGIIVRILLQNTVLESKLLPFECWLTMLLLFHAQ